MDTKIELSLNGIMQSINLYKRETQEKSKHFDENSPVKPELNINLLNRRGLSVVEGQNKSILSEVLSSLKFKLSIMDNVNIELADICYRAVDEVGPLQKSKSLKHTSSSSQSSYQDIPSSTKKSKSKSEKKSYKKSTRSEEERHRSGFNHAPHAPHALHAPHASKQPNKHLDKNKSSKERQESPKMSQSQKQSVKYVDTIQFDDLNTEYQNIPILHKQSIKYINTPDLAYDLNDKTSEFRGSKKVNENQKLQYNKDPVQISNTTLVSQKNNQINKEASDVSATKLSYKMSLSTDASKGYRLQSDKTVSLSDTFSKEIEYEVDNSLGPIELTYNQVVVLGEDSPQIKSSSIKPSMKNSKHQHLSGNADVELIELPEENDGESVDRSPNVNKSGKESLQRETKSIPKYSKFGKKSTGSRSITKPSARDLSYLKPIKQFPHIKSIKGPSYLKPSNREYLHLRQSNKHSSDSKPSIRHLSNLKPTIGQSPNSKSTIGPSPNSKSTIGQPPNSKSTIKQSSNLKQLFRQKSDTKESGRESLNSKPSNNELSTIKEANKESEGPRFMIKESDKTKSSAKESENTKSSTKESENTKSTAKESENTKSTAKELENAKFSSKESENTKSTAKESKKIKPPVNETTNTKPPVNEIANVKKSVGEKLSQKSLNANTSKSSTMNKESERKVSQTSANMLDYSKNLSNELGKEPKSKIVAQKFKYTPDEMMKMISNDLCRNTVSKKQPRKLSTSDTDKREEFKNTNYSGSEPSIINNDTLIEINKPDPIEHSILKQNEYPLNMYKNQVEFINDPILKDLADMTEQTEDSKPLISESINIPVLTDIDRKYFDNDLEIDIDLADSRKISIDDKILDRKISQAECKENYSLDNETEEFSLQRSTTEPNLQTKFNDKTIITQSSSEIAINYHAFSKMNIFKYTKTGLVNHRLRQIVGQDTETIGTDVEYPSINKGNMKQGQKLQDLNRYNKMKNKQNYLGKLAKQKMLKSNNLIANSKAVSTENMIPKRSKRDDSDYQSTEFTELSYGENMIIRNIYDNANEELRNYMMERFDDKLLLSMLQGSSAKIWKTLLEKQIDFYDCLGQYQVAWQISEVDLSFKEYSKKQKKMFQQLNISGKINESVYTWLDILTGIKLSKKEFDKLIAGDLQKDLALFEYLNTLGTQPRKFGMLKQPSIVGSGVPVDQHISYVICQIICDLSLLQRAPESKYLSCVLNYHFHKLNHILHGVNWKVREVFFTLKMMSRLSFASSLLFRNPSQYRYLINDLVGVHQLFWGIAYTLKSLKRPNLRVLMCTMQVKAIGKQSTLALGLFVQEYIKKKNILKPIEVKCGCIISCHMRPDNYPTFDIYYERQNGNHFESVKKLMGILKQSVSNLSIHEMKIMIQYPTGEVWAFNGNQWLKQIYHPEKYNNMTKLRRQDKEQQKKQKEEEEFKLKQVEFEKEEQKELKRKLKQQKEEELKQKQREKEEKEQLKRIQMEQEELRRKQKQKEEELLRQKEEDLLRRKEEEEERKRIRQQQELERKQKQKEEEEQEKLRQHKMQQEELKKQEMLQEQLRRQQIIQEKLKEQQKWKQKQELKEQVQKQQEYIKSQQQKWQKR